MNLQDIFIIALAIICLIQQFQIADLSNKVRKLSKGYIELCDMTETWLNNVMNLTKVVREEMTNTKRFYDAIVESIRTKENKES